MAKKLFTMPFVILSGWSGGDGSETGGGSGGSTDDPTVLTYQEWLEVMLGGDDNDKDGDVDFGDYILWWQGEGLDAALLQEMNPGQPSYDPSYYKA